MTKDKFLILILNSNRLRMTVYGACYILPKTNTAIQKLKIDKKTEAPTAVWKPASKTLREKDEMDVENKTDS